MENVSIYGDNRFEQYTKIREACRGIAVRDGKVLLSYEVYTDQWMIPGGGVEQDESHEACYIRELAEETGVPVKPLRHYLTINEYYEECLYASYYFICKVTGQTERMLTWREKEVGVEPRWIPLEDAVKTPPALCESCLEQEAAVTLWQRGKPVLLGCGRRKNSGAYRPGSEEVITKRGNTMEYIAHYESPLGGITLASDGDALIGLWFDGQKYFADVLDADREEKELPVFEQTKEWLDVYFSGKLPDFTPPLNMKTTDFRKAVWEVMLTIPFGKTMTYGEIAERIAKQKGIRRMSAQAVGGAVGHNSISLIIPCHRVVGMDGSLTGYAGGIQKKVKLLEMEGADMSRLFIPKKGTAL